MERLSWRRRLVPTSLFSSLRFSFLGRCRAGAESARVTAPGALRQWVCPRVSRPSRCGLRRSPPRSPPNGGGRLSAPPRRHRVSSRRSKGSSSSTSTRARERRGARLRTKIILFVIRALLPVFFVLSAVYLPREFWEVQLAEARESAGTVAAIVVGTPPPAEIDDAFGASLGQLVYPRRWSTPRDTSWSRGHLERSATAPAQVLAAPMLDGLRRGHGRHALGRASRRAITSGSSWVGRSSEPLRPGTRPARFSAAPPSRPSPSRPCSRTCLSRSVTRPLESVTVSLDQLTRQPRWDSERGSRFGRRTRSATSPSASTASSPSSPRSSRRRARARTRWCADR